MTDRDLRRIAHDAPALRAFYAEHVEAVQRFIARRVGDPHRAADLTAEVFLAAIEAAPRYRGEGAPRAWLFGIARVVVAADSRRGALERRATRRLEGSRPLDGDDVARIQERIDAAAQARLLHAALRRLPDSERAVLELVALDELSVADAASALGIGPVAARVPRTARARPCDANSRRATQPRFTDRWRYRRDHRDTSPALRGSPP
jgi:RNA polymerase sigma factor (sigma-70 family)